MPDATSVIQPENFGLFYKPRLRPAAFGRWVCIQDVYAPALQPPEARFFREGITPTHAFMRMERAIRDLDRLV